MERTESIGIKIAQPTRNKRRWLESMAQAFSDAIQLCLDEVQELRTSSRAKIHKASYYRVHESFGLPSDYARMAVIARVGPSTRSRDGCGEATDRSQDRTIFLFYDGFWRVSELL